MAVTKDAKDMFMEEMQKYYGKPSEVGKNIKKSAKASGKAIVKNAKAFGKGASKALNNPVNQATIGVMTAGVGTGVGAALKAPKIAKGVKAVAKGAKAIAKKIKGTPRKKLTGYGQLANRVDMDYLIGSPYRVNKKTGKFKFRIEDEDIPFGKNLPNQPTSPTWSKNLKPKSKSGTYNPTKKEREQVRRFIDLDNLD